MKKCKIFVSLLIDAGFNVSNDSTRLIYDISRINDLIKVKNFLSSIIIAKNTTTTNNIVTISSDNFRLIEKLEKTNKHFDDIKNIMKDMYYKCICGNYLTKLNNATTLYDDYSISCNLCCNPVEQNQIFWHCNQDENQDHPYGFDICDICIAVYNPSCFDENVIPSVCCNNAIQDCKHLKRLLGLKQIIKLAPHSNIHILQMLNDFNHLMLNHNSDDEFEFIYNKFGKCNISKCNMVRRHFRNRELNLDNNDNNDDMKHDNSKKYDNAIENREIYKSILDRIHCYFVHCYDIGCRLTSKQRQEISTLNNMNLLKLNEILKPEQKLYQKIAKSGSLDKFNKFGKSNNLDYGLYSFGQQFFYWPYYKTCSAALHNYGYTCSDWYVKPKYNSLKDELINNSIAAIRYKQWKEEYSFKSSKK